MKSTKYKSFEERLIQFREKHGYDKFEYPEETKGAYDKFTVICKKHRSVFNNSRCSS